MILFLKLYKNFKNLVLSDNSEEIVYWSLNFNTYIYTNRKIYLHYEFIEIFLNMLKIQGNNSIIKYFERRFYNLLLLLLYKHYKLKILYDRWKWIIVSRRWMLRVFFHLSLKGLISNYPISGSLHSTLAWILTLAPPADRADSAAHHPPK